MYNEGLVRVSVPEQGIFWFELSKVCQRPIRWDAPAYCDEAGLVHLEDAPGRIFVGHLAEWNGGV